MLSIRNKRLSLRAAILACAGCSLSVPSLAQDGIEEIVVTAQRKAESIQELRSSDSAFGAEKMRLRCIDEARDLQTAVPNLTYTGSGVAGGEGFQIRGVGNSVGGTTGDVGVAIHHNNAPQVQSPIATAEAY